MSKELTPKRAYELFEDEGMTNNQIAEKFDSSVSTVIRRRRTHEETQDQISSEIDDQIDSLDLGSHITDDEPEDNPYAVTECPACGDDMDTPDSAGQHDCPHCETTLKFGEGDV